jgi:hypothetical protein
LNFLEKEKEQQLYNSCYEHNGEKHDVLLDGGKAGALPFRKF